MLLHLLTLINSSCVIKVIFVITFPFRFDFFKPTFLYTYTVDHLIIMLKAYRSQSCTEWVLLHVYKHYLISKLRGSFMGSEHIAYYLPFIMNRNQMQVNQNRGFYLLILLKSYVARFVIAVIIVVVGTHDTCRATRVLGIVILVQLGTVAPLTIQPLYFLQPTA